MKTFLRGLWPYAAAIPAFIFTLTAVQLLTGCNQKPDPRIAKLEERIQKLEFAQSNSEAALETGIHQISLIVSNQMVNSDALYAKVVAAVNADAKSVTIDPATGLPSGSTGPSGPQTIDPSTGLPLTSHTGRDPVSGFLTNTYDVKITAPKIIKQANRVTEQNDVFWRWSYSFSVVNPSDLPLVDAEAEATWMDGDQFILKQKKQYHLNVPANFTNRFSFFELVDTSVAGRVKYFTVKLVQ